MDQDKHIIRTGIWLMLTHINLSIYVYIYICCAEMDLIDCCITTKQKLLRCITILFKNAIYTMRVSKRKQNRYVIGNSESELSNAYHISNITSAYERIDNYIAYWEPRILAMGAMHSDNMMTSNDHIAGAKYVGSLGAKCSDKCSRPYIHIRKSHNCNFVKLALYEPYIRNVNHRHSHTNSCIKKVKLMVMTRHQHGC